MSLDKISLSPDKTVPLLGVSTCRGTSVECLRHIYLSLRQSTTYPGMTSKPYSASYFEHSSNWYFSIHSLWRYIIMWIMKCQLGNTILTPHHLKAEINANCWFAYHRNSVITTLKVNIAGKEKYVFFMVFTISLHLYTILTCRICLKQSLNFNDLSRAIATK